LGCRKATRDVRESDVGDGGVENLHEGAHGDDEGDDPGIEGTGGRGGDGERFAWFELGGAGGEGGLGAVEGLLDGFRGRFERWFEFFVED